MEKEILEAINDFNIALSLLDDYDHQCVIRPKGHKTVYRLEYRECRDLIDSMRFSETSNVFGVEKEKGKLTRHFRRNKEGENMQRMRLISEAYNYIKDQDPGTCITKTGFRRLINEGRIPVFQI